MQKPRFPPKRTEDDESQLLAGREEPGNENTH